MAAIEYRMFSHTCGDGCCTEFGYDVYVDEVLIGSWSDYCEEMIEAILKHFGVKIDSAMEVE